MVKCQKLSLWDKEQEKNIHYHHFTEQHWLDVMASTIRQEQETKTLRIRKEEITFSVEDNDGKYKQSETICKLSANKKWNI